MHDELKRVMFEQLTTSPASLVSRRSENMRYLLSKAQSVAAEETKLFHSFTLGAYTERETSFPLKDFAQRVELPGHYTGR